MIKLKNWNVYNFENAFRGLRNPLDSWEKSDTKTMLECAIGIECDNCPLFCGELAGCAPVIGEKDMKLAQKLILSGNEHAKFMRQIFVTVDITAPIYWWKEMDQYRVSCTTNSCSTMHTLTKNPITIDNFSFDYSFLLDSSIKEVIQKSDFDHIINFCEMLRSMYVKTKNPYIWRALVQILPQGWNQLRTWTANYQVLRNIYFQRKDHKLSEWQSFCSFIKSLPYGKELITIEKE